MHSAQPLVLDAQFDPPRRIHFDDVDELPRNTARRKTPRQRLKPGPGQQAFEHTAHGAPQPDFDLGHAQQVGSAVSQPFEVDVVHADYLAAVNVDDLAVDQVLLPGRGSSLPL